MPEKKKTKKTKSKKEEACSDATITLVDQFKDGLEEKKGESGLKSRGTEEYRQIRKDLIKKALSTVQAGKHIQNCKEQIVANLRYIGEFKNHDGLPSGKEVTLINDMEKLFYQGPIKDGVPNTPKGEEGISIETNGSVYIGEWKEGEAFGNGILFDNYENIFMGEFIAGQLEGTGRELLKNGMILEGSFKVVEEDGNTLSQLHGVGRLLDSDGYSFDGTWEDGMRNGAGIEKFPDGLVCLGDWHENIFTSGIIRHPDGTIEEGYFNKAYELEGDGERTFNNGTKIKNIEDGIWENGYLNGLAQVNFPDKSDIKTFKGEFKETIPNGFGRLSFKNGTVQEGQLENGNFTGKVKLVIPRKYTYEGELSAADSESDTEMVGNFVTGVLEPNGKGKITFHDGSFYEGEWKCGMPHGDGVLSVPEQFQYSGDFVAGKFHGKGILTTNDDSYRYEGDFKDGKKSGKGKEFLSNNVVLEGTFSGDETIALKSINFRNLLDDESH